MPLAPPTITTCSPTGYNSVQLGWTNGEVYDNVLVHRDGVLIATLAGSAVSYLDSSCSDGISYSYVIRGVAGDPPETADSAPASAITPLIPDDNLSGYCVSNTEIHLDWRDNTGNETGHKVYRDGALAATLGQNVIAWNDTGRSPATWYHYNVVAYNGVTSSSPSNEIDIFTADPPNAPSNPTATAVSTSQINTGWQDNSSNETGFKIEQSDDGSTGWAQIGTVGAGVQSYPVTGLASNTLKYFRIRAYNDSGNSGYTSVVNARTFAAIADPTNLAVIPWSDTKTELTFQDNSSEEDGHEVHRKLGAGAYGLVTTLAPNVDFYRDTGLVKGSTYTYKVRAKQGASYSGYSNEVAVTTISEPSAPTVLAISEIKDKSMRLTWTPTSGEVGYKIEKSVNGGVDYTEVAKLPVAGAGYFLARDLTAGTEYYFKIRAYNNAGNSAYTAAVNATTLAAYVETNFQALARRPLKTMIYLVEMNPKITLSGFTLTATKTYTYEVGIEERGIDIEEVFENGVAYAEKASIADVEATASTFYFDFYGRKLYVHTSGGVDPINYLIEGAFWLYFTNYSIGSSPTIFNDKLYLPLLERADIPDASQEISSLFEGNLSIASGTVTIKNAEIGGEYYWDKRYARYTFENRKVRVLAGGPGFAYADFEAIFPAFITGLGITDRALTFDLQDFRGGIHRNLPVNHFWQTDYPNLSNNDNGKVIPLGIGTLTNFVPVCIDSTNRKYKLRDGRIKSVSAAKQNGTSLVADTDYFIDYQRGIIILARGMTLDNADSITVNYEGLCNAADELLTNGADIFIWACMNLLDLSLVELDLDSIYYTKYQRTATLAAPFHREISSDEFFRNLEHSCRAHSFQDAQGRLGFRALETTPDSAAPYIRNCEVFDFSRERGIDSIYRAVNIHYNESPQFEDTWSTVTAADNTTYWKKRASQYLDIYTYLTAQADAETVATAIRDDLNKDYINFSVPNLLFGRMAGDLVYFSRDRFPSTSGSANEEVLRILSIQKQISTGKTMIRAVEI